MKNLTVFLLAISLSSPLVSIAADESVGDESVGKISIDQISADTSVLDGKTLVSTGQPDEAILAAASGAGFVAVIDMRLESEDRGIDEKTAVEAHGMQYLPLPISGADDVTFENAAVLNEMLAGIDGPVLAHCASGNRVGALMALRASLNGADAAEALAAGKATGLTRLEPVVVERLNEK